MNLDLVSGGQLLRTQTIYGLLDAFNPSRAFAHLLKLFPEMLTALGQIQRDSVQVLLALVDGV